MRAEVLVNQFEQHMVALPRRLRRIAGSSKVKENFPAPMDDKPKKAALWISLIYAGVGTVWILASDRVVEHFYPDSRSISHFQTYKGLGYIAVTAVVLYLALRVLFRENEKERASRLTVEASLRESEQMLRRAQSIARLGRWAADLTTGTINASPEGAAMIGWEPGAHKLDQLFALVFPEDVSRVQAAWTATLNGDIYDIEHRLIVRDKVQWVHVRAEPERDRGGKVVRVVGITRDITERKEAEAALRKSEERYRNLTEQAADSFFVHDIDGHFVEVNRRACESLGYTREELLAMKLTDIEQEFDQVALQKVLFQLKPGQARTLVGTHRRKNGSERFFGGGAPITSRQRSSRAARSAVSREVRASGRPFSVTGCWVELIDWPLRCCWRSHRRQR